MQPNVDVACSQLGKLKFATGKLVFFFKVVNALPRYTKCKCREEGKQGFIQRGGALESPPPTRNLEIEYGYYLHVTELSMCHQNVVWKFRPRLRQKQSGRM